MVLVAPVEVFHPDMEVVVDMVTAVDLEVVVLDIADTDYIVDHLAGIDLEHLPAVADKDLRFD
jgi:hypothetical protein